MERITVTLHEDNAGGLYLQRSDQTFYYSGIEHAEPGQFAADAAALMAGDVSDWTAPQHEGTPFRKHSGGERVRFVAFWDGAAVEHVPTLGTAAARYLGITGQ
jgi:hypothetical protein